MTDKSQTGSGALMTATKGTPVLRMNGITKRYGMVEALVDVDLSVHAHEVVALVGDNGAGKSTLAKMIAGVIQPDAGTIEIDGTQVNIPSPSQANELRIASVFQDVEMCNNLDVTANIFLGQELRSGRFLLEGEMEQTARKMLNDITSRIPSVATPVEALSAGQRQSVAIARALIGNPRLIVLDEPTAALSVAQTAEVLTHIQRLRDLGLAVVLISHNLGDIRAVADRIEVLRHGRNNGSFMVEDSTQEDIISAITMTRR